MPPVFTRICRKAALFCWLIAISSARAHNPDTSYARILVTANALELRLTYDIFTLLTISDLDADHDQRATRDEFNTAVPAIEKFLRGAVVLQINGQAADLGQMREASWPADSGDAIPAKDWHSANGLVAFHFHQSMAQTPKELAIVFDFFDKFGQRHIILGAFENSGRTHEVTFSRHEPDYLYDLTYADPGVSTTAGAEPARSKGLAAALVRFLKLGVEHIFLGYDHICFLIALVVVSRFREVVKIVTAFTAAHSITLILAALQIVSLPVRLVECAIALTIIYVALENLWTKADARRWPLAFGFGLVHGFGFASVLSELGLPTAGTIRCLLSFNVGVELGQLAIVLVLLPAILALRKWRHGRIAAIGLSLAVGLFGIGWFTERAFSLNFMPL